MSSYIDKDGVLKDRATGPNNRATKGLLVPGTILNLYNRPQTAVATGIDREQPKGSRSTTYSKTFTADDPRLADLAAKHGKTAAVLLPTVHQGRYLSDDEAIARYKQTGEHLGIFDKWQSAEPYAEALHQSQAAMGDFYGSQSKTGGQ